MHVEKVNRGLQTQNLRQGNQLLGQHVTPSPGISKRYVYRVLITLAIVAILVFVD